MKCFPTVLILFSLAVLAFAQEADKARRMNEQVSELYQKGDLDAAIPIAQEIVKLQRQSDPQKSQNLINALENLAHLRLTRLKRRIAELGVPQKDAAQARKMVELVREDAAAVESSLREIISISQGGGADAAQITGAKNNLAWLLYNHIPNDAKSSPSFDKENRSKFEALNRARSESRFEEARGLYQSALKESVAVAVDGETTMLTLFNLAQFEMAMGEFENAIPNFERCIAIVEKKYGRNDKNLQMPMESYLKVLVAAGKSDLAFEMVSRLVRITGNSMTMPKTLLDLSRRSENAYTILNAPNVEQKARATREQAELENRRAMINVGAVNAALIDTGLATSTLGKEYFEDIGAGRIIRVPVRVSVDEKGKVLKADALAGENDYKAKAEEVVRGWKFRPLILNGRSMNLNGYVVCLFLSDTRSK